MGSWVRLVLRLGKVLNPETAVSGSVGTCYSIQQLVLDELHRADNSRKLWYKLFKCSVLTLADNEVKLR